MDRLLLLPISDLFVKILISEQTKQVCGSRSFEPQTIHGVALANFPLAKVATPIVSAPKVAIPRHGPSAVTAPKEPRQELWRTNGTRLLAVTLSDLLRAAPLLLADDRRMFASHKGPLIFGEPVPPAVHFVDCVRHLPTINRVADEAVDRVLNPVRSFSRGDGFGIQTQGNLAAAFALDI